MRVETLRQYFGTKAKPAKKAVVARALGVTKGAITNWGEFVPPSSIWRVEQATNGAIKADPEFYERLAQKRLRARKKQRRASLKS